MIPVPPIDVDALLDKVLAYPDDVRSPAFEDPIGYFVREMIRAAVHRAKEQNPALFEALDRSVHEQNVARFNKALRSARDGGVISMTEWKQRWIAEVAIKTAAGRRELAEMMVNRVRVKGS